MLNNFFIFYLGFIKYMSRVVDSLNMFKKEIVSYFSLFIQVFFYYGIKVSFEFLLCSF